MFISFIRHETCCSLLRRSGFRHYDDDVEKTDYLPPTLATVSSAQDPKVFVDEAPAEEDIVHKSPVFRWFSVWSPKSPYRNLMKRLAQKIFSMGVEVRGIERVPEEERSNKHVLNVLIFWWSVNTVLTTVPIGGHLNRVRRGTANMMR